MRTLSRREVIHTKFPHYAKTLLKVWTSSSDKDLYFTIDESLLIFSESSNDALIKKTYGHKIYVLYGVVLCT